jgi:hypothetical protein
MSKVKFLVISILLAVCLSGCAFFTGTVTPTSDQESRIAIGGFQTLMPGLKEAGDAFVVAEPQYAAAYQATAIPIFITVNKMLAGLEAQGAAGQAITATQVLTQLQTQIGPLVALFMSWGNTPIGGGGSSPAQIALLVVTAMATASDLFNQLSGLFSGNIPTWQAIQAQNATFQGQLGYTMKAYQFKMKLMKK